MLHFSVGFFIYKIVLDKVIVKDKVKNKIMKIKDLLYIKDRFCFIQII
jgi:hypothetical protein